MLTVKPDQIFEREDESIFEANLRCGAVLEQFQTATQEYLPLKGSIYKYLITSDLRLGSSVGRAEG